MGRVRRSVHRGGITLPAVLATLAITACVAEVPPARQPRESAAPSTPQPRESAETRATRITLAIGAFTYAATLADNPTARDFAAQLPLTLTFKDLNRMEKIAPLPRTLTTTGVPDGADPDINDIGYYSPSNDLVLYYGDVGYFAGIVRIGAVGEGMPNIARQPDGFTATIALADPEQSPAKE